MSRIGTWYSSGPYEYSRAEEVAVDFRTELDAVADALPPDLEPDTDARGWLRVTRHRTSSFGPYIGAYLGVYATFRGEAVRYTVTGLKTDFMGVVAAREVWGLPLGLGDVSMTWHGNALDVQIRGAVGEQHARVRLQTLRRAIDPPPGLGAMYTARRHTFTDEPRTRLLLRAQNSFDLTGAEAWDAAATLQLTQGTAMDDWSLLPVREVLRADYRTGGRSTLGRPDVVAEW